MSEQLVSSVPSMTLLSYLTQLDEQCQGVPPDEDIDICWGPFGAFKVTQGGSCSETRCLVGKGDVVHLQDGLQEGLQEEPCRSYLNFPPSDLLASMPMDSLLPSILDNSELDLLPRSATSQVRQ